LATQLKETGRKKGFFFRPVCLSNHSLRDYPLRRLARHQPRLPASVQMRRTPLGSGAGVNVNSIDCDDPPPGPATTIANDAGADK
jgi:hypothetical protein